jgi:hypothetical protein
MPCVSPHGVGYGARSSRAGTLYPLRAGDQRAEAVGRRPFGMHAAVGQVESGRQDPRTGEMRPWPWLLMRMASASFATKAQAVAAVAALQAQGVHSIEVGCMQVNLMHHPDHARYRLRRALFERPVQPHWKQAQVDRGLPFRHAAIRGSVSAPRVGDVAGAQSNAPQRPDPCRWGSDLWHVRLNGRIYGLILPGEMSRVSSGRRIR